MPRQSLSISIKQSTQSESVQATFGQPNAVPLQPSGQPSGQPSPKPSAQSSAQPSGLPSGEVENPVPDGVSS